MYVRTPQASAWKDSADDASKLSDVAHVQTAADRVPQALTTRWARTPLQSRRHGRCIALKVEGGEVLVGVAGSPRMQWLPVSQVFNEREVAEWLARGF